MKKRTTSASFVNTSKPSTFSRILHKDWAGLWVPPQGSWSSPFPLSPIKEEEEAFPQETKPAPMNPDKTPSIPSWKKYSVLEPIKAKDPVHFDDIIPPAIVKRIANGTKSPPPTEEISLPQLAPSPPPMKPPSYKTGRAIHRAAALALTDESTVTKLVPAPPATKPPGYKTGRPHHRAAVGPAPTEETSLPQLVPTPPPMKPPRYTTGRPRHRAAASGKTQGSLDASTPPNGVLPSAVRSSLANEGYNNLDKMIKNPPPLQDKMTVPLPSLNQPPKAQVDILPPAICKRIDNGTKTRPTERKPDMPSAISVLKTTSMKPQARTSASQKVAGRSHPAERRITLDVTSPSAMTKKGKSESENIGKRSPQKSKTPVPTPSVSQSPQLVDNTKPPAVLKRVNNSAKTPQLSTKKDAATSGPKTSLKKPRTSTAGPLTAYGNTSKLHAAYGKTSSTGSATENRKNKSEDFRKQYSSYSRISVPKPGSSGSQHACALNKTNNRPSTSSSSLRAIYGEKPSNRQTALTRVGTDRPKKSNGKNTPSKNKKVPPLIEELPIRHVVNPFNREMIIKIKLKKILLESGWLEEDEEERRFGQGLIWNHWFGDWKEPEPYDDWDNYAPSNTDEVPLLDTPRDNFDGPVFMNIEHFPEHPDYGASWFDPLDDVFHLPRL